MLNGPCGWNEVPESVLRNVRRTKPVLPEGPEPLDVERPAYYAHGIEPIDYMRSRFTPAEFRGYLRGNCLKYLSRYTDKNGVEDLRKAEVYLKWLIELEVNNVHSA